MKRKSKRILAHARSLVSRFRARISSKGVAAGYYNVSNFGDLLTPDALEFVGLKTFHCQVFRYADCLGAGSILHLAPNDYRGAILGSGFIQQSDGKQFPNAKAYCVRGELTRDILGLPTETQLGDPGLLVNRLYGIQASCGAAEVIGLVPHYTDKDHPAVNALAGRVRIIDVCQKPKQVTAQIAECSAIISSSLHGLIVADSLGIKNRQVIMSGKLLGGDFKFRDYLSCFGETPNPHHLTGQESMEDLLNICNKRCPKRVEELQEGITSQLKRFASDHLRGMAR